MGTCRWEHHLPLQPHLIGSRARIFRFVRPSNGRCPACDFLKGLDTSSSNKFKGSFDALSKIGAPYHNMERFKGLIGPGKPLWAFKEHDQRLYCFRRIISEAVDIVLFNGWAKDKKGRNNEEVQRVLAAQNLLVEFLQEFKEGVIK